MSVFLYQTSRLLNNIKDVEDLTNEEKREHAFKVLCEWPSAREQLRLSDIYDPNLGIHLGDKLWTNQQYSALKVYKTLDVSTEDILEKIIERDGTLNSFSTHISSLFSLFPSNSLDEIEKELQRSAQNHGKTRKHRYQIQLLKQGVLSCITDSWDEMSSSTEYNLMSQKFKAMTLFEFLDKYPLPTNLKEIEEQSNGRIFRFLHSINPERLQAEVKDSLDCANSFWNVPDIKAQLTKFIDEWSYDRNFNNRYCFGFVDSLIELMWIREKMLAVKNMNASQRNILWDNINLKNESHTKWLFNEVKKKPSVFLKILQGTIQQLTENNESENVVFTLDNLMELEFKAWLCICEHEYLKLVNVTLFEKLIDHNLIYNHDAFVIQEIINSGLLLIILSVLKLFIDDRNSFSAEQWRRLHQTKNQALQMEKTIISQINEEVKTDALDMTQKSIMSQNNEEVKTDTLDITLITTPEENTLETRESTKIGSSFITDEKLTLPNLTVNENEEIPSNTETVKVEGKEKLYTKVLNETTLRILCQKPRNATAITQDMQEDAPQEDKFKDTNEITLLQGFSVSVISSTSLLRQDDKINFQLRFLYYLSLSDEEKIPPAERNLSEKLVADAAGSTSLLLKGSLDRTTPNIKNYG